MIGAQLLASLQLTAPTKSHAHVQLREPHLEKVVSVWDDIAKRCCQLDEAR